MTRRPRLPDTMGKELSSFSTFKGFSDALKQTRDVLTRFSQSMTEINGIVKNSAQDKRQSGYGSFMSTLGDLKGRIGGNEGRVINNLINNASKSIESGGGANISGKELSSIIHELRTGLMSVVGSVKGEKGQHLSRMITGLGHAEDDVRHGGFKSISGGQGDMIKAAFGLSSFKMLKDAVGNVSAEMTKTATALKDPGLKASLQHIKTGLDNAAASANSTSDHLKALGNAKKDIENLIKNSSGLDKGMMQALRLNLIRINTEFKKANSGQMMQKFGAMIAKPFVGAASTIGKSLAVLGSVKRTFDVTNGVFQSINGKVNQFARMQMGITAERAGFGRQIRGAGMNFGEMIGAISAGRSAGMDDKAVVNQMVGLQTQLSRARWGEGGMIESAGRWGISTFNESGDVKSANEMMIEFSRKLRSLGNDMEKLQFLTHMGFSPDKMEYVANYEKEAKRMEMVRANPHMQTVLDRANILDESGYSARVDKYTKIEQKRRQILNQNAIDEGLWPGLKRSMSPENWFFNDWTAREKGVRGANAEISNEKMTRLLESMLQELQKNGGDRQAAFEMAMGGAEFDAASLTGLVDALKQAADEKGDPAMIKDFEAAFEDMTGIALDTRTNMEKMCEKLAETMEKVVGWAGAAVKKLMEFLSFSPEAKKEAVSTFLEEEVKTATVYAAGKTGEAILEYAGARMEAGGAAAGSTGRQVAGSATQGVGKFLGWVTTAYTIWDTFSNINDAISAGREKDKEIEELKRRKAERQRAEKEQEYADGGKSSKRAIFGEAGPEYAIPVKHTQRTADLLNQASQESGFGNPRIGKGEVLPEYAEGGRFPEGMSDRAQEFYRKGYDRYKSHKRQWEPDENGLIPGTKIKAGSDLDDTWWEMSLSQEDKSAYDSGIAAYEEEKRAQKEEAVRQRELERRKEIQRKALEARRKRYEEEERRRAHNDRWELHAKAGLLDFFGTAAAYTIAGLTFQRGSKLREEFLQRSVDKKSREIIEEGEENHPGMSMFKHGSGFGLSIASGAPVVSSALKGISAAYQSIKAAVTVGANVVPKVAPTIANAAKAKDIVTNIGIGAAAAAGATNAAVDEKIRLDLKPRDEELARLRKEEEEAQKKEAERRAAEEKKNRRARVARLDDKQFIEEVRNKISEGASESDVKQLFEDRGLWTASVGTWANNKKFMAGGDKGDEEGIKMLAGLGLAQENVNASLLAGKAVDVTQELKNLHDKYAIAWKGAGRRFDSSEQRVNIAARQAGNADATTFKEMNHYFKEGDKYGADSNKLLAKIYGELAKKEENKGKSYEDIRKMAEAERRKQFLGNMSWQDLKNRFKYRDDGTEIKDEKEMAKERDEAFKKEGIEVKTNQKFDSEIVEEFNKFKQANPELSDAAARSRFARQNNVDKDRMFALAAYGKDPDKLSDEDRESWNMSRAGRAYGRNKDREARNKQRNIDYRAAAEGASDEEIRSSFRGRTAKGDYEDFMGIREKIKNGEEVSEQDKKYYEDQMTKIGRRVYRGKGGSRSGYSSNQGIEGARGPRRTRRGSREDDVQATWDEVNLRLDTKQAMGDRDAARKETYEPSMWGKRLLDKRANEAGENGSPGDKSRSRTGGSRRSGRRPLPTMSLGTGKKLSITGGKGLSSLTGGTGKISISKGGTQKPTLDTTASGRHRYRPEDDTVSMSSTYNKARNAEDAAESGNRAIASSSGSQGGKSGTSGGSVNMSAPITVTIVVQGSLDEGAAKHVEQAFARVVSTQFNDSIVQNIRSSGLG